MLRRLLLALAIFLTPLAVNADVVRLCQETGTGYRTIGSGVTIGIDQSSKQAVVLTCGHGWVANQVISVCFKGNCYGGRVKVTQLDDYIDLGIVTFNPPKSLTCNPLGEIAPQKGAEIVVAGFGNDKFLSKRTECKGYYSPTCMVTDSTFRQGDSGGGVFWGNRVVGIISGNEQGKFNGITTSLTGCRKFVKDNLGQIPICAGEETIPADGVIQPKPDTIGDDRLKKVEDEIASLKKTNEKLLSLLEGLDVTNLKGEKGDPGTKGEKGPKGDPGLKGDVGPSGEAGVNASIDSTLSTRLEKNEREIKQLKEVIESLKATVRIQVSPTPGQ